MFGWWKKLKYWQKGTIYGFLIAIALILLYSVILLIIAGPSFIIYYFNEKYSHPPYYLFGSIVLSILIFSIYGSFIGVSIGYFKKAKNLKEYREAFGLIGVTLLLIFQFVNKIFLKRIIGHELLLPIENRLLRSVIMVFIFYGTGYLTGCFYYKIKKAKY